ncbi:acetyltransferase [Desulfohalotomaculum tongense]|uniref:acetate--CoA ligase alpha subunit n=1 Tax=Desulforadius tongensis TaxID=1216062 RepID=UPI0019566BB8|nr:acetate--CoA ligase [Desulforadius tongensis]MBM7854407.1 acetyltransferase [Desulforadius tongensis]
MADLRKFFHPGSVAVVGASAAPGKIGNAVIKNIITSGFQGDIYPINPKAKEIEGFKCHRSLAEVGKPIDMAVLALPAKYCIGVAEEAAGLGIKNLVVLSAGFKETGSSGMELEKQLLNIANKNGINMLGPNCVGIMDTITPINASFSAAFPPKGDIAFISQSGAMLISVIDWSLSTGLGFSRVISLGNKAQLNEVDFIDAIADDPNTSVILAYIEDVAHGEKFLEVAKRASAKKPVIIFKSGTSQAGAQAASSHTGALVGSDLAYETSFEHCGVIRARTITELFDLAMAFSYQPVPAGSRVAVITNAGGPGIVTTDAIENQGLNMARFSKNTIEELRSNLPAEANIYNPVDVLGDAKEDRFEFALDKALADDNVDSAVVLICPTAVTDSVSVARSIVKIKNKHPGKPVFTSFMGGPTLEEGAKIVSKAGIPNFTFPEPAVYCLRGMVKYAQLKEDMNDDDGSALAYSDVDKQAVKAVFYDVFRDKRRVLLGSESCEVAKAYGIPAAPIKLATTVNEAVQLAEEMGYPVVLKVASPRILHKTDVGGVLLNLDSPEKVREGYIQIMESVQRYLPQVVPHGIEVQKMMPSGTELIIGMSRDVHFGPMIAFGLGGIYVNLLNDVSFRLAKGLTTAEITAMIGETKAYTLLKGYRGQKPSDIGAVIDVIARVAKLVLDFPEITEMDINPIFAYEEGLSALDIKITIS